MEEEWQAFTPPLFISPFESSLYLSLMHSEIARVFLRLGATSFGVPLAHIALMRREFVQDRGWLSDAEFMDLNGAINLIPDPNSTELAIHIGDRRAGTPGLWVAGFILRADFVEKLGWITDRQLLDAVAIGQLTPGPLFTSATFIGYQIGGFWGGIAATAGIFLPPFLFVTLLAKTLGKLSGTPHARAFLDSVNASSLALMILVTLQLARAAFWPVNRPDFVALGLGILAALALWKTQWNPALILALGGVAGWFARGF